MVAIEARLSALTGVTEQGFEQTYDFPLDAFGKKLPYRDFEPGSSIPAGGDRLLAAGEQAQPHVFAFQIHHVAPTRRAVNALAIESDISLIGWQPSDNAGPITTFFFNMYDEFNTSGERVQWVMTRFYQTTLGQSPTL